MLFIVFIIIGYLIFSALASHTLLPYLPDPLRWALLAFGIAASAIVANSISAHPYVKSNRRKIFYISLAALVVLFSARYIYFLASDYATVQEVKKVVLFLHGFYQSEGRFPSPEEFDEAYPQRHGQQYKKIGISYLNAQTFPEYRREFRIRYPQKRPRDFSQGRKVVVWFYTGEYSLSSCGTLHFCGCLSRRVDGRDRSVCTHFEIPGQLDDHFRGLYNDVVRIFSNGEIVLPRNKLTEVEYDADYFVARAGKAGTPDEFVFLKSTGKAGSTTVRYDGQPAVTVAVIPWTTEGVFLP